MFYDKTQKQKEILIHSYKERVRIVYKFGGNKFKSIILVLYKDIEEHKNKYTNTEIGFINSLFDKMLDDISFKLDVQEQNMLDNLVRIYVVDKSHYTILRT